MYAILSHGGRQYRVTAGDRLLVDRLAAEVGSVVGLEPVLLTGGEGDPTALGADVDGVRVAATVVAHVRGKKLRVFKYKAKKRTRKMAGYRSDLTELRVESILAKGAALPARAPAERADRGAVNDDAEVATKPAPRGRARKAAVEATAEPDDVAKPATKARAPRATTKTAEPTTDDTADDTESSDGA